MASKVIYLAVTIEDKDEGRLPRFGEVVVNLQDQLADITKHDSELPWRVRSLTEVHVPGTGTQIGDFGQQISIFSEGE
jgi:hypothetical protein